VVQELFTSREFTFSNPEKLQERAKEVFEKMKDDLQRGNFSLFLPLSPHAASFAIEKSKTLAERLPVSANPLNPNQAQSELSNASSQVDTFLSELADVFGESTGAFRNCAALNSTPLWHRVHNLGAKLSDFQHLTNRCRIGFIGNRGAGKSTIVNKVLGVEDLLPTNADDTSTASVTEISSWKSKTFEMFVVFLPQIEIIGDLQTAEEILSAENCNLKDPPLEITRASEMWKATLQVLGKDPNQLQAELLAFDISKLKAVLSEMRNENNFVPGIYQDYVKKGQASFHYENVGALKNALFNFASKDGNFWPIVERIVIRGPFHELGKLPLGCTLLDIPGDSDGVQSLVSRAVAAIQSCHHRFLILRRGMLGTPTTGEVIAEYLNDSSHFSIIISKAKSFHPELNGEYPDSKSFHEAIDAIKKLACKQLSKICKQDLGVHLLEPRRPKEGKELLEARNLDDFDKLFDKMLESATNNIVVDLNSRAGALKSQLAATQAYLRAILLGDISSASMEIEEFRQRVFPILENHFSFVEQSIKAKFDSKMEEKWDPNLREISGAHGGTVKALFRGKSALEFRFKMMLVKLVSPEFEQGQLEQLFDLGALKRLIQPELEIAGISDDVEQLISDFIDEESTHLRLVLSLLGERSEICEALWKKFRSVSMPNIEAKDGAKKHYLDFIKIWLKENQAVLVSTAYELFNAPIVAFVKDIKDSFNNRLRPEEESSVTHCQHRQGEPSADCKRCALLRLIGKKEAEMTIPTPAPAAVFDPEQPTWRTVHRTQPFLTQADGIDPFLHSTRPAPGYIYIFSDTSHSPGIFKIDAKGKNVGEVGELYRERRNEFKIEYRIQVQSRFQAAFTIIKQVLQIPRWNQNREFFEKELSSLIQVVVIVCESLDTEFKKRNV